MTERGNSGLEPGSVIDGRYRLERRIGTGGMGEVWRAVHIHLDTPRVVKVVRRDLVSDADAQARFVREARLATRVQHPNVAVLHDFATLPDGRAYMAWELIEGQSLAAVLREHGPLPPQRAALIAAQALDGLGAIHRAGIVHRDISPDNIMISPSSHGAERIRIIDLGIARDGSLDAPAQTQTGMFLGKFKYCSPEHLGMLPQGESLDGRADLYSMGIVLYEMLTGATPFEETTPHGWIVSHTTRPPRALRDVSPHIPWAPELEAVLTKALAKDRAQRFGDADSFASELRRIVPALDWSAVEQTERTRVVGIAPPVAAAGSVDSTHRIVSPSIPATERTPASDATVRTDPAPSPAPGRSAKGPIIAAFLILTVLVVAAIAAAALWVFRQRVTPEQNIARSPLPPPATATVGSRDLPVPPAAGPETSTTMDVTAPATATVTETAQSVAARVQEPEPIRESKATRVETEPVALEPGEPVPVTKRQEIRGRLQSFLARKGARRFSEDAEGRGDFTKGIIPDYDALTRGDNVQWMWIDQGVRLSEHSISIGAPRNRTAVDDAEMLRYLGPVMQEWVNEVTEGSAGSLRAETAIWWAAARPARQRGVGIEMVFRDESGNVVAMLRHLIRENTPADAAEEMAEAVQDFVSDNQ